MIAIASSARGPNSPDSGQQRFLALLPPIERQIRYAFRGRDAEQRDELVAEAIAAAFVAFLRLCERGKQACCFATPLARYAIQHVKSGRRIGSRLHARDVMSPWRQRGGGVQLERLDYFNFQEQEWRELLIEERRAGPADTAAARVDFAEWFRGLAANKRRIAWRLARGETTGEVAQRYGVSPARISQLRRELHVAWRQFQGEPVGA